MTRKDYVVFAKMLSVRRPAKFVETASDGWSPEFRQWTEHVQNTADVFARDNARFSRSRFYAACGVQEGEL